jgi:hypothetical protein
MFLDHMGITKGIMQLIERDRAELLYAAMRTGPRRRAGRSAIRWPGCGNWG